MGLSRGARERALRGIVSGELWVGLAWTIDGKSVREVNDPAYSRRPVTFDDVRHEDHRSTIATSKAVDFAAFAFDSPDQIRRWFVIDTPDLGKGTPIATGLLDPHWMTDGKSMFTVAEAVGKKDVTPIYPRPLAGHGLGFGPGDLWIHIEEGT